MKQDPVCGMYLIKVDEALMSELEGIKYYFCCPVCKKRFDRHPHKFAEIHKKLHQKECNNTNTGDMDYV